jgi:hypothetical protein
MKHSSLTCLDWSSVGQVSSWMDAASSSPAKDSRLVKRRNLMLWCGTQGPWGSGTWRMLQEVQSGQNLAPRQKDTQSNSSIIFESLFNKHENRSCYHETKIGFKYTWPQSWNAYARSISCSYFFSYYAQTSSPDIGLSIWILCHTLRFLIINW